MSPIRSGYWDARHIDRNRDVASLAHKIVGERIDETPIHISATVDHDRFKNRWQRHACSHRLAQRTGFENARIKGVEVGCYDLHGDLKIGEIARNAGGVDDLQHGLR